jgi:heat shock protein HtpX
MKRILLFLATNLAIVLTVSLILNLLGIGGYLGPNGQLMIPQLAVFCFIWGMVGSFISLQISRWVAKRAMGVELVDGRTGNDALDWLYNTVATLTRRANLPMPEVGFYRSGEVNAFATGPSQKRSLVAVSTGLLERMSRPEVEAVLGHEVAHIKNGDMVTMALLQGVVNAFVMFIARIIAWVVTSSIKSERGGRFLYMIVVFACEIVLGILGSMVTAWFSRRREFRADAGSAELVGSQNMAAALRRLLTTQQAIDTGTPAMAAYKISDKKAWLGLLSTHPPLEERIAALEMRVG